jgi:hypothetical protein
MDTGKGPKFFNGSLVGTAFTLTMIVLTSVYLGLELVRMNNFEFDQFKSEKVSNNMENVKYSEFNIQNGSYDIMPTIEI